MSTVEPSAGIDDAVVWAGHQLGCRPRIQDLRGDLSPRRYRRLIDTGYLLATHPREDLASLERFLRTTELLEQVGVRVPQVRSVNGEAGWLLVEDLGHATLFEVAPAPEQLGRALVKAADCIARIATIDLAGEPVLLPPLDAQMLLSELEKTLAVALVPLGYLSASQAREFHSCLGRLCERIATDMVPAHRDFMVRNLVPCGEDDLGVLDHQDLRLAPAGYDLASLLVDSVALDPALRHRLEEHLVGPRDRAQWVGVASQRCLKILGTFVGFAARGVPRHLPLCRVTFEQLARLAPEVPELGSWIEVIDVWAERAACDARFAPEAAGGAAVVC